MQYALNYSGTRFLSTNIKITQFPGGFRLNSLKDTGRSRNEQGKQFLPLSVEELVYSEKFILRCLKYQYFNHEMETLTNLKGNLEKFQVSWGRRNDTLKKTSSLYMLVPFVDKDGLLRISGRIRRVDVPLEVKHPLILPKMSHISDLIVRFFHESVGYHEGRGVTHNAIRQAGYWIVDGHSAVARTASVLLAVDFVANRKHRIFLTYQKSVLHRLPLSTTQA